MATGLLKVTNISVVWMGSLSKTMSRVTVFSEVSLNLDSFISPLAS